MVKPFNNKDLCDIREAYSRICENLTIPPNPNDPLETELRKKLPSNYDHADRIVRWFRNDRRSETPDAALRSRYVTNLGNIKDLLSTYDRYMETMRKSRMEKSKVRLDTPKGPMEFDMATGLDRIRTADGAVRFVKAVGDMLTSGRVVVSGARKYAIADDDRANIGICYFSDNIMVWSTRTYKSTNKFVFQLWQNAKTLGRGDVYGDPSEQTPYCTHAQEHWDAYSWGDPNYTQYWILKRDGIHCANGNLNDPAVVAAFNALRGRGSELLIAMDDSNGDLLDSEDDEFDVTEHANDHGYGDEILRFESWRRRPEMENLMRKCAQTGELSIPRPLKILLNEFVIPEGVRSIEEECFCGCHLLQRVHIPPTVEDIGTYAFHYCRKLHRVNLPDGLKRISCAAFKNSGLESVTIPDSVTKIGVEAFASCKELKYAVIGSGVRSIGDYAFGGCSALRSVNIPDSVTCIRRYTFCDCKALAEVTIPDSVTRIDAHAFQGCAGLGDIVMPDSVTYLEGHVFHGCLRLENLKLSKNLEAVSTAAFYMCSNLAEVEIPDSVIAIWDYAFCGCKRLRKVSIGNHVQYIGGGAFKGCSSLSSVTLPDSVKTICPYVFGNCNRLVDITIPNSVREIGDSVFSGCSNLSNVSLPRRFCNLEMYGIDASRTNVTFT